MRKKNYKGRCEKRVLSKCIGICRTYDALQYAYADVLEENDEVKEFQCNVPLASDEGEDYTTDFYCEMENGDVLVLKNRPLLPAQAVRYKTDGTEEIVFREPLFQYGLKLTIPAVWAVYIGWQLRNSQRKKKKWEAQQAKSAQAGKNPGL